MFELYRVSMFNDDMLRYNLVSSPLLVCACDRDDHIIRDIIRECWGGSTSVPSRTGNIKW